MRNDSMLRKMGPKMHGYLDYGAVGLLAIAPTVFGWDGAPQNAAYILAATQLTLSLLTAYPLGAVRMIPFTVHATVEFMTAVLMIALPWLAGFSDTDSARNFFVMSGIALLALWTVTDYKLAERSPAAVPDKVTRKVEHTIGR